jgi:SlyX protein
MSGEERLIDLEAKLAHQDQSIHELSEEIYQQQKRLDQLGATCEYLLEQFRLLSASAGAEDHGDEPPPHY